MIKMACRVVSLGKVAVDLRATVPKATPTDRRPEVDGYPLHLTRWTQLKRASQQRGIYPTRRKRRLLAITDTLLKAIAALANMGLRSRPKNG